MAKPWSTENVPILAQDNVTVWRLIVSIVAAQHEASQLLQREPMAGNTLEVAACVELKAFMMHTCGDTFKPCMVPLSALQAWQFLSIAVKPIASSLSNLTLGPSTPIASPALAAVSPAIAIPSPIIAPSYAANPVVIPHVPASRNAIPVPENYPKRDLSIPVRPTPLFARVVEEEKSDLRRCYSSPPRLLLLDTERPQPLVPISKFVPNEGRRKALVIGINYAGGNSLGGCVRDSMFIMYMLLTKFDFKPSDICWMVDEQVNVDKLGFTGVKLSKPSRENILEEITWLMGDAVPGDSLFFSFSGHGTEVPDGSGDEKSGWDQAICALGDDIIVDDELYDVLVRRVPRGARLTALVDACHSGTVLDLPYMYDLATGIRHDARVADVDKDSTKSEKEGDGTDKEEEKEEDEPVSKRKRFRNSLSKLTGRLKKESKKDDDSGYGSGSDGSGGFHFETLSEIDAREHEETTAATLASRKYAPLPDSKGGTVLMLSGCHDKQYSFESDKSGEKTGMVTLSFIEVLERGSLLDSKQYTFTKLLKEMELKVSSWSPDQSPQFSSSHPFNLNSPFIL